MTSLSSSSSSSSSSNFLQVSTSPSDPFLIAQSRHCAEYLGFACLIGDGGQSLVPSAPIISKIKVAQQNQEEEQQQQQQQNIGEYGGPQVCPSYNCGDVQSCSDRNYYKLNDGIPECSSPSDGNHRFQNCFHENAPGPTGQIDGYSHLFGDQNGCPNHVIGHNNVHPNHDIHHNNVCPNHGRSIWPLFFVEYPGYPMGPLLFSVNLTMASASPSCEVCIVSPSAPLNIITSFLTVSPQDPDLLGWDLFQGAPIFCFTFPRDEPQPQPCVVQGSVSLPPDLSSFGIVAHFGLRFSTPHAGVITNCTGELVGFHTFDFCVYVGDEVAELGDRNSHPNACQIVIKDSSDMGNDGSQSCSRSSRNLTRRSFLGIPPNMLKTIQEMFVSTGEKRKQAAWHSRIYTMNQAQQWFPYLSEGSMMGMAMHSLIAMSNGDEYRLSSDSRRLAGFNQIRYKRKRGQGHMNTPDCYSLSSSSWSSSSSSSSSSSFED